MQRDLLKVKKAKIFFVMAFVICSLFTTIETQAKLVEYNLTIAGQKVNITTKPVSGMTINGSIPGPVLRFSEGDTARIHVHNAMDVDTSIHWHGILVPPGMDGVPYTSFPPIGPGATFTYEFPIRQAGTYWYHSHTNLQEQSGVYGAIVIEPRKKRFKSDQDHVVLFSDWSDEDPHVILRTLKRGSEWYALQKGGGQSIFGAARLGMLSEYFKRELQRMPPMDIADVAYDRFLANGNPEVTLPGKPGETVRLRIIDGSSTTYFHLNYAGGPMTIVAADGQDVEPVVVDPLLICVAETYDLLIKVPDTGAYEFRATAHDGSGAASVWLGSGARHYAQAIPKPNLYQGMGHFSLKGLFALTPAGSMNMPDRHVKSGMFDKPGMMGMDHHMHMGGMGEVSPEAESLDMSDITMETELSDMDMGDMQHGEGGEHGMHMKTAHAAHAQSTGEHKPPNHNGKGFGGNFRPLGADISSSKNLAVDGMDALRPWPPYEKLRAIKKTAFSKSGPVRDIRLTLDGDMERYVWFLNNKPLSESDSIHIRKGEIVRFIMINRTMMHHPMHLHGHFFRVVNAQGDFSPLKHTVNVAPMSTTVIEFDANAAGDWFFHCHLLYHMKSGMAQVVHYRDFILPPETAAVRPELYRDSWYFWGMVNAMSHMGQGSFTLSNTRHILDVDWEFGWEDVEDPEWEVTPTWRYYINRFTQVFIGAELEGIKDHRESDKGVLGVNHLLPLNIEFMTWIDTYGEFRFEADKVFELTPRLMLFGQAEFDTEMDDWKGEAGATYLISKEISLIGQWHSDFGLGGGLQIRF